MGAASGDSGNSVGNVKLVSGAGFKSRRFSGRGAIDVESRFFNLLVTCDSANDLASGGEIDLGAWGEIPKIGKGKEVPIGIVGADVSADSIYILGGASFAVGGGLKSTIASG